MAKIFTRSLPLILFVAIIICLWKGLRNDPHHIPSPLLNQAVPQFKSRDLFNQQQVLTAGIFKGHVSVLNVFASWCVYCLAEHAVIVNMSRRKNMHVYGLNYKDKRTDAMRWLREYGNPFQKIITDPTGVIAIDFGVYGAPETFIIDANAVIRYKYVGAVTEKVWQTIFRPEIKKLQLESRDHA